MAEPSNKTILLMDAESSEERLDTEKAVLRRMLYAVLKEGLSAVPVEPTEYRVEDRGDGVFVLIDPAVPKPALLRALLTAVPERLASDNRLAAEGARLRLRIVVHSGEVALDERGAVGGDLDHAFRLLEADALRQALRATAEPSVLCVSEAVHRGVVRHRYPGVRAEHFHPLTGTAKHGKALTGWYHDRTTAYVAGGGDGKGAGDAERAGAGNRAEAGPGAPAAPPAPAAAPPQGGAQPTLHAHTGNFFFGTAQFGGDAVAGDKYGGPAPERPTEGVEGTER
ncbi:hypothetical protein [Streptomyces sp. NPDC046887]|uniref:hypothetical protein n=1 Tax=Streptomyces sp. NPDC046887 TaxID=3155472 RepID=UPI0033E457E3